ncbi:hypothetical protein JW949_01420 [Candidatus Woesearchaeota archaeon]|nr:hypothetical protein [Candidatus Woesearchaeota archaeon]
MTKKKSKKISKSKKSKKTKKNNKKTIILSIIGVIILAAAVFFILNISSGETRTVYNIDYALKSGDDILEEQNNFTMYGDSLSSVLKLKSEKADELLKTLNMGEEKAITLEAKDAYGEYNSSLTFDYPRVYESEMAREFNVPLNEFTSFFGEDPMVNETYSNIRVPWEYTVMSFDNSTVDLYIETEEGKSLPSNDPRISAVVKEVDEDGFIIETILTPEIGETIQFTGYPEARVVNLTDDIIIMDSNNPYAGKTVTLTIKLNEKETVEVPKVTGNACTEVENAPTLQVFIMSYCRYGLQALKGMVPVWEKFQGTANIELRFVSYTMHGETEEEENNRMICIREEQCDKLLPYLRCFAGDGDYERCLAETGVDKAMLNTCMENNAETYMEEDSELNELYGVTGSPSFVLNGEKSSIGRSPDAIKTAICDAFEGQKPSECSEIFDTATPSPGLGWDGSSSSSSGQC